MGEIRTLPARLAAKIRAGEFILRPASVAKELIENAVDAGASRVAVEIDGGGVDRLRCVDDGRGMDAADARLCLERHATSKLFYEQDLDALQSFGFRGEALASILTVAEVGLHTRRAADETGTAVRARFGTRLYARDSARTPGTTVDVRHLFRNMAPRRRALRSAAAEARQITRVVREAALSAPEISFHLRSGERELLCLPRRDTTLARIRDVYGDAFADSLVRIRHCSGDLRIDGFVTPPAHAPRQSRRNHCYVNDRVVDSSAVRGVVAAAMRARISPGRRPEAIVFIQIPPSAIDANVSADKSRVDFRHERDRVMGSISRAVKTATATPEAAPVSRPAVSEACAQPGGASAEPSTLFPLAAPAPPTAEHGATTLPERPLSIRQVARTYIVADLPDGTLYIDQHSAHERIVYARLCATDAPLEVQALAVPVEIPVHDPDARLLLEDLAPTLASVGFETGEGGSDVFWLYSVPAWAAHRSPERALADAVDDLSRSASDVRLRGSGAEVRDRALHRIACRTSIHAGTDLSEPEMLALWDQLRQVDLALADIHGRAGAVFVSHEEIRNRLGRASLPRPG